jgi:hypothetical protein
MTLVRKRNHAVNYYRVVLYPTLFDDFLVVHHCGKNCSRTPNKSYFKTRKEALIGSLNIISAKKAEGFELLGR